MHANELIHICKRGLDHLIPGNDVLQMCLSIKRDKFSPFGVLAVLENRQSFSCKFLGEVDLAIVDNTASPFIKSLGYHIRSLEIGWCRFLE